MFSKKFVMGVRPTQASQQRYNKRSLTSMFLLLLLLKTPRDPQSSLAHTMRLHHSHAWRARF